METPDWLAEVLKQGKSVHCHVMDSWKYAEPYTPPACTLKPFQHVLGRNTDDEYWRIDFFDEFVPDCEYPYVCCHSMYRYCIPYEGNEKYKGTSNNFVND